jgi:NADH-quinone oxidoreductase subunit G
MPKLTIDGKELEVAKGTRIIEAAKQAGIDIPFYCYHPGLSIAGNCRMCLVEVEKTPKLQIACHMECGDGMVVRTDTEKVKQTRKHVLEFLLVNHPLDCPICDQAGECWLQDYYLNYGAYDSRVNEDKIKKPKAVAVGPHVMLDAERCILCSRCVRFSDEISKTSEFGIVNRGNHAEITVFPGKEVNNPYSGNVVDICPVGALTDRDFRFKMRVWYLESENTLCNGCSRGCNIQMQTKKVKPHHAKSERVMRLKPRFNDAVNKWWMCDEGRYGYKFHDLNRITGPLKRAGAKVEESHWETVLPEVAKQIQLAKGKIAVLLSPQMSNEEMFLAKKLFKDELKLSNVLLVKPNKDGYQDEFLIRADKNPNSKGAELLGFKYDDKAVSDLFERCAKGELEGLVIFGQDLLGLYGSQVKEKLARLKWTLYIGTNHTQMTEASTHVLPASTYAETDGTFTNFEGRVQRFARVLDSLGESKPIWKILIHLARQLEIHMHYDRASEIFADLAKSADAFKGLSYQDLQLAGADIRLLAMPTIPELTQHSNLIFHNEILGQSEKATIREAEKPAPAKV